MTTNTVMLRGSACVLLPATEKKTRPRRPRAALTITRMARNENILEEKHGGTISWNSQSIVRTRILMIP